MNSMRSTMDKHYIICACVCVQTVEERRTVRDGQGNEETTVIRSGLPDGQEGPRNEPATPTPGQHTHPYALNHLTNLNQVNGNNKLSQLQCT